MTTENTTTDPASTPAHATVRTVLRAEGLTCPSCVAKIEHALGALPGVRDARVRFSSGRIEVDHDPQSAPVARLVDAVASAGYAAHPSTL